MKKSIVVIPSVTPKEKKLDKFGGWIFQKNLGNTGVTKIIMN